MVWCSNQTQDVAADADICLDYSRAMFTEISHFVVTGLRKFDYCSQLAEDVVYRSCLCYINGLIKQDSSLSKLLPRGQDCLHAYQSFTFTLSLR